MMLQKMILMWVLILSLIMSMSSSYWFTLWMTLEINMMVFIPMMNSKNFLSSNSMMYYYIIQSLSSSLFFFSSLMSYYYFNQIFTYIMMISMLIKIGSAPFHTWYPQISEGLSYFSFFILSTLQKTIPLNIISIINNHYIMLFIFMSAIMGSLGGYNQMSLKKILAFSSISHLSWMLTLILTSQYFWLMYFLIYMMILLKIVFFLSSNNYMYMNDMNCMKMSIFNKMYLLTLFLSLGGMPPFLGFFSKWISITFIVNKFPMILVILIMSSLVNLFFYIRIMFPMIMNINNIMKSPLINSKYTSFNFLIINFMMIIMIVPLMFFV
uniref:NADH-ubiquinone oxidoreductase chain 2 n=1 Tax=Ixodes philipi TaxID=340064 RepID=Q0X081_9ACAR|nr:NADH dehydrogenase subunit 2 [Ixodes philipi]BAF02759.1 NADH dehydrogenase subunit 2 [Ixodes philipi]BAF02761.1 NADH dehydrogenase subunit 2 [Ixodes philipi]